MTHRFPLTALLAAAIFILLTAGCQNDTTVDPGGDAEISAAVESAARAGYQTIAHLGTQQQFFAMVSGTSLEVEEIPESIQTLADVNREIDTMRKLRTMAVSAKGGNTIQSDSLLWFQEWTNPIAGTAGRRAAIWDPVTGEGRLYQVIHQFPALVRLQYDSTEFRIYFGPSLTDTSDDRLRGIDKLSRFADDFFIDEVIDRVDVTDYDAGNDVSGATGTNRVIYRAAGPLVERLRSFEFNPDGSGTIGERLDYDDNTWRESSVTFFDDYRGEFSERWRTGTTVSGSFDLLQDNNRAALTRLVTFANHPWLSTAEHLATYELDPVDSSSSGVLTQRLTFRNGNLDTARVAVDRFREQDVWKERFRITTSKDGQSDILVSYFDGFHEYEGTHVDRDGRYARFNGVEYDDGSGELWLSVWASESAWQNGDDPLLTLHLIYNGDGGGSGEITEAGTTYRVTFDAGGRITVADPGGATAEVAGD